MIDSAVLQLHSGQFKLREKNRFNEAKKQQGRGFSVDTRYCNEHAKSWKKRGVYCPMFGLLTRARGLTEPQEVLEIQVSLQKVVHGTNLFDVDKDDLDIIFQQLLFFL